MFLENGLPQIRSKFHHGQDWPGREAISRLHQKADGLFVYASTACRFLDDPWGDSRLEAMFKDKADGEAPQQNLDGIYSNILAYSLRGRPQREKLVIWELCRKILGSIVTLLVPVSIRTLAELSSTSRTEVERILGTLHSIVEMPTDHDGPVGIVHLSFRDFLTDQERCELSPEFWVDASRAHQDLVMRCLDIMEAYLHQDMCNLRMPGSQVEELSQDEARANIPLHLQYACRFWIDHLAPCASRRPREVGFVDGGRIHRFLLQNLLYWLETLSLLGASTASVLSVNRLEQLVDVSTYFDAWGFEFNSLQAHENPALAALLHDARRFLLKYREMVESTPLQLYVEALMFAPNKSIIRECFLYLLPPWIVKLPQVEDSWNAEIMAIEPHKKLECLQVVFSPAGDSVLSLCDDDAVRLHDVSTGAERAVFRHDEGVHAISFHPEGTSALIALHYGEVLLQDLVTGEHRSLHASHMTESCALAVSPDGGRLAVVSNNG